LRIEGCADTFEGQFEDGAPIGAGKRRFGHGDHWAAVKYEDGEYRVIPKELLGSSI